MDHEQNVEKRIIKAHLLLTADTSHKLTDEVAKDLTYEELLETLRRARDFVDIELFMQGK